MCNLYDIGPYPNDERFDWEGVVREAVGKLPNSYVAPGTPGVIVKLDQGTFEPATYRWGFHRRLKIRGEIINRDINNARDDKLESGMWGAAWRSARCLIPAIRFYEWSGQKGRKRKHAIHPGQENLSFWIAGLWESYPASEDEGFFTMLTTSANPQMASLHDRMPLILHPEDCVEYLAADDPPIHLVRPFSGELTIDPPVEEETQMELGF